MRVAHGVLLLAAYLAPVCGIQNLTTNTGAASSPGGLLRRQSEGLPPAIANIPAGVLTIGAEQTICGVVLVSESIGVTSATCFEYDDNLNVNKGKYNMLVGWSEDTNLAHTLAIGSVTIHPEFDPSTFANNIAIIQTVSGSGLVNDDKTIVFQVGSDASSMGGSFYFVQRSMAPGTTWNAHKGVSAGLSPNGECGKASALFGANQRAFICNDNSNESFFPSNDKCMVPFRYVVGMSGDVAVPVGIYSHSAIGEDEDFCSSNSRHHYYILLANYLGWVKGVTGYTVQTVPEGGGSGNTDYQMDTDFTLAEGIRQYSLFDSAKVVDLKPAAKESQVVEEPKKEDPEEPDPEEPDPEDPDPEEGQQNNQEPSVRWSTKYTTTTTTTTMPESTRETWVDETNKVWTTVISTQTTTVPVTTTSTITDFTTTTELHSTTVISTSFIDAPTTLSGTETQYTIDPGTTTISLPEGSMCPAYLTCMAAIESPQTIVLTEVYTETTADMDITSTVLGSGDEEEVEDDTTTDDPPLEDTADDEEDPGSFSVDLVTVAETTVTKTVAESSTTDLVVVTLTETLPITNTDAVSEGEASSEQQGTEESTETTSSTVESLDSTGEETTEGGDSEPADEADGAGSDEQDDKDSNDGPSLGLIIGIVAGAVVILSIIGYLIYRRWKKQAAENNTTTAMQVQDQDGSHYSYATTAQYTTAPESAYYGAYTQTGPSSAYNTRPQTYGTDWTRRDTRR